MNGNRMKYASTPTYGMQKRGFAKKAAPVRQVNETPDFSKAPDPIPGMPAYQPQQSMPVMPPVQPMMNPQPVMGQQPLMGQPAQNPFAPMPPYFQSSMNSAPQQTAQIPFAAPAFVPPASGMQMPPMQSMHQQLPLGNTASPFPQSGAPFSSRSQGFVPPQATAPNVQQAPVSPFAAAAPFSQPQQTIPPFSGMQQPHAGYAPVQPGFAPQQPAQPVQPVQPVQQPMRREAMNADKLWTVFLFGLLPLLFIPCIFLPGSWDVLRYVFMGLTVVGLGAMWYRQMYASATRLIVSMVYVALCIVTIAMLMQGSADVRRTSAVNQPKSPAVVQPTPEPDQAAAMAQPAATPTPAPTVSGPSQAEKRLELFMSLWQVNNATEMVYLVQPSWCSQQQNPSQALFNVLKNRTPEDFVIEDITGTETDNSRTITMRATINKNTGKAPSIYRFMIMMVKEGDEWYVNPNSLATNDEVQTVEENVVNNKNEVGDITPPPRTTVTPAPPASTTLYYNQGANYYHMDPNCPSVKSEYLPFDMQFAYADLKEVMRANNLSPCLKCNAPTSPLN